MSYAAEPIGAKLGVSGTFEVWGPDGVLLKTIELNGAVPLSELGLTVEEAQALVDAQTPKEN